MDPKRVAETDHLLILQRDGWDYVERKRAREAVVVLAMTGDGHLILTEQFRRAVNASVIDFPAGLIGDEVGSSDPAETAKRELEEETGFACEAVELIVRGPSSPGITSEIIGLYRARGAVRRGEGGGVSGEEITVHVVPRVEIGEWLRGKEDEGVLIDLKVWAGLYWLTNFVTQST